MNRFLLYHPLFEAQWPKPETKKSMRKSKEQIEKVISFLKKEKERIEAKGERFYPDDRIMIQLDMLEGRKHYSHWSNDIQRIESIAYETSEWLKGEYYDTDDELFGEGVND